MVADKDDYEYEVPIPAIAGTCRRMRSLSNRAIYFEPEDKDTQRPGCFIPAGFAQASTCGHVAPMPYGIIRTVGRHTRFPLKDSHVVHKNVGNTSLLCVPNAECRTSRYIVPLNDNSTVILWVSFRICDLNIRLL